MRDAVASARTALLRGLAWYTALALGAAAGAAWVAANAASPIALLPLAFAAGMALLLAYYAAQHVRDLRAEPLTREGTVSRRWSRADLVIAMQSYYVRVDRGVFRVRPEEYIHLEEGSRVRVVYFPHTLHVVSIDLLGG